MNTLKKSISLLLCLVLCVTCIPVSMAENIEIVEEPEEGVITIIDPTKADDPTGEETQAVDGPEVKVSSMSTKGISLKWAAVNNASQYQLVRREGSLENTFTVEKPEYLDADVQMGVTYSYSVRAQVNGAWTEFGPAKEVAFYPFNDVSGKKTLEYLSWAFNNGIVTGTSTTTFSPNAPCTRIQFVMMLWKMNGSVEVSGTNPFADISGKKTTKAILWALDQGVINSGTYFNPDDNISRVQIVMILWKLSGSPVVTGENPFTDVSGSKTIKAVLWAYQTGITKGTSATTFAPNADCTRIQLVVFLYKYNNLAEEDGLDINKAFPDEAFRAVIKTFDTDRNGKLTESEIEAITEINCSGKGVVSVQGIEYLTALKKLDCSNNRIETLNLSKNITLTHIVCSFNETLTAVELPFQLTVLTAHAFEECTSLQNITIPSNVTVIEESAFEGCTALTSVAVGSNLVTIAKAAFKGCTSLRTMTVSG